MDTEATVATTPDTPSPGGLARTIRLSRAEFAPLARHLDLPEPSPLSPLTDLCAPAPHPDADPDATGPVREADELLREFTGLPPAVVRMALLPLAVPDRVVDARSALFNSAPTQCRLYASHRCESVFVGLRPRLDGEYELLAPFASQDLAWWVQLQVQFSSGQPMPLPQEELTAEQLAFLLVLVDAYKTVFFRSFAARRTEPQPVTVSVTDLLEAQQDALRVADRRWISHAVAELFAAQLHPAGRCGVTLPPVTAAVAERELRRYEEAGYLERAGAGDPPAYEPGLTLATFAGTLFTWISLLALHDVQVVGHEGGRPVAQEDMVLFVVTEPTVWALVSQGLTRAREDWLAVRFGLRALGVVEACNLADEFLRPIPELTLPEEVYRPQPGPEPQPQPEPVTVVVPAQGSEPLSRPPAPPAPGPPAGPAFRPTHRVPSGGMSAWTAPDPSLQAVTRIDARVELEILERAGDWAHIVCANGWSAWVDGRRIEELRP
ncbi:SH3 domain-containing protein [Kitasatospora cathayae]|uniref:SH3 domain-containing protein n=1 Tax=Kitasatospora cathayae TaxID=3004092 RepID=A0ABY7QEB1_9ACTN|nr:hypothetical protein [Kitasatospora sp. HUAS 3-15]WBP91040.1 hypothetical protein O1G21_37685 [Kitasatospora sp. HUAS 3-15]